MSYVRAMLLTIVAALALFAAPLQAQVFFSNTRVGNVLYKHTTVGTTTAAAIASSDVAASVLGWKICNDAVNTSTYLLIGEAADAATDGVMVGPGVCFECPNCNGATLKAVKVKAQAASNGYSVVQFKQQ